MEQNPREKMKREGVVESLSGLANRKEKATDVLGVRQNGPERPNDLQEKSVIDVLFLR